MMGRIAISILCLALTWSNAFATVYNVSTSGNDGGGDGSAGNPWRTLGYALSRVAANQGHVIKLGPGTFVENGPLNVPTGVSIEGSGLDVTILKATSSFYYYPASPGFTPDKFLIKLVSGGLTNGAQSIKSLTIDGDGKKLHGGIFVQKRTNILIEKVKVTNVNFCGIWYWSVNDSVIRDFVLFNCAWGSTGWCSGALHLTDTENIDVFNFDISESQGYGIKNIAQTSNTLFKNIKVHDGRVSVEPSGKWNDGKAPNITIEFWASGYPGTEIYNCYIDNHISLVNFPVIQPSSPLKIYNNFFDIAGPRANGRGYGLELAINDVEIYDNYFNGGSTAMVNWSNRQKENWKIHHNTFYRFGTGYPLGVITSYQGGMKNAEIYNNTCELAGTSTVNFVLINNGGVGQNITLRNNLIINSNTSYQYYPNRLISLDNGATMSGFTATNNLFYNLALGAASQGTLSNNLTVDPKIKKTGARPQPYYEPQSGSPLIDAGVNVGFPFQGSAPDIGAFEFGSTAPPPTNQLPQVNITAPANSSTHTAGSNITISANASDPDGTVGRVEFFSGTTKLGEDLSSPYNFTWNNVPQGTYTITARATDNANGVTTSAPVTITVVNANQAPTVSITSPADNQLFTTGSTVTINANAADADGTISKVEFFNGTTKLGEDTSSPYSFAWPNVPGGTYTITAKATDNQNATKTSAPITITVSAGNNPPTVNLTGPANNAVFPAGSDITITANASDPGGAITKVEFFNGNVKLGQDTSSPYSFVWSGVAAGTYTIKARATDDQGAVTNSSPRTITVEPPTTPPTVNLTSPQSNASFSVGSTITLSATASNTSGSITRVEFFNGTTKLGEDLTAPYTFDWSNAPVGTHTLGARATDSNNQVGNSSLKQITVIDANIPPAVTLTGPANNTVFPTNSTITFTATASDADGTVTKVEFFQGTIKLGEDVTSPYSFSWNNVPDGNYVLTAKATDNSGATAISSPRNVTVNSAPAPPSVTITSPTNGQTFSANSNINITASATASIGSITKVEFFNGSNKLGEDVTSPYSFNWNNVPTGNYTLTARVTTDLGATNISAGVNIIVSTASQPPLVSITSPSAGAAFAVGSTIPITVTATDANGSVVRVEFFNGSTKLGEDLTSPYSFSWPNAPAGSLLIVATATDNSGASASAQVQIFVDAQNSPPIANAGDDISVQSPVSDLIIQGTGTDDDGVITAYDWQQISGPTATFSQNTFGELVFNATVLGQYVFELTVTDNGNLTDTDQLIITVTPSLLDLESIPRYFSPNNDGINDLWEWPSIEIYQNSQLLIFNRFGQKVFETPSYENNWDGTMNGQPLQEDAYYYIVKLPNTDLKGAVRIIR